MQHMILRPLEPLEQLAWWYGQVTPSHFLLTGEFVGATTPEDWARAIDTLQCRHPLLAVGVVPDPPRFAPTSRPIPLRIIASEDPQAWQHHAEIEMHTRFDPFEAPLARAVVLHRADRATLILVTDHCIADGISIMHAFGEIRDILEEGAGTPHAVPPGARSAPDFRPAFSPDHPTRPLPPHPPAMSTLRLGADLTARLHDKARRENTTMFGAMAAALTLAGRSVSTDWKSGDARIIVPVDMRRMAGLGTQIRIAVGLMRITAAAAGSRAFWDLARALKADLASLSTPDMLGQAVGELDAIARAGFDAGKADDFMTRHITADAMISSLGVVPFETRSGSIALEALWGPSVLTGQTHEQVIGAVTVDGALCLLHTSYTPLPGLLALMEEFLAGACDPGS